jgi:NAD(P)H-hydrate epimerase
VLLKGARTVVAAADGRRWQLLQAAPQAARAGLGDVLAGYAAGRGAAALACGMELQTADRRADASLLAAVALAHAEAGLACLQRLGPGGVSPQAIAADLQRH